MSGPAQDLVPYGYVVIVVMAGFVLIPYLRGKSELLTGWNFLLVGCAIYTGLGSLAAVFREFYWQELTFVPTRSLVNWYLVNSAVFLLALLASYYFVPLSVPLASRSLQKWPMMSLPLVMYILSFSGVVLLAVFFLSHRPGFFTSVSIQLSHKAIVFSTVFAFALWYSNRSNFAYLGLFFLVLMVSGLYAMLLFKGRRLLIGVALGPILYLYWTTFRYWKPKTNLILIGTAAVTLFVLTSAYSMFRNFSTGQRGEERTVGAIVERIGGLDATNVVGAAFAQALNLPQQNVQYSMLVRQAVEGHVLAPKPFNSLIMLATYPIPRVAWPEKPRSIGNLMPTDVLAVREKLSWGVGVPGHGAFEGGIPVLILYAVLATFGIRFLDEPLKQQPANPFLISILASAAPHVCGWPRGDLFVMTAETIECFIFAIIIGIGGRILFGTARSTTHSSPYSSPATYGYPPPGLPYGARRMRS